MKTGFWNIAWFILLVSGLLSGGCHQNAATYAPSQQTPAPKLKRTFFEFGAVTHSLADVYAEPTVSSERLTQCIFGDVVRIEDETEWWYAVKVGPEPELSGWVHKTELIVLPADAMYLKERKLTTITIRQVSSEIAVWPSQTIPIAIGTELPFIGETEDWYLVRLPNNDVGKIARKAVLATPKKERPLIQMKKQTLEDLDDSEESEEQRQDIIETAQQYLGKVYVWGGTSPRGFDCSGLTYFVYRINGIELPRISSLQYRAALGKKIKKAHLHEGDLVFFETYRPGPSHVGIYIGNNQFIHASPKYGVTISNLDDPYFKNRYIGAKAVLFSSL
ncbi:NLP/P60 protein [Candidatus Moduliflexus flocculans]|uniref:NLP/P60 protein n=1 Tax=Candidatus Moduliflexus flocculans TaxID=1499966 RepID=A0A0S6VXJ3_9BACT|nr:NLP/P60 protein [Candidatus Moduliflexus flocculans]